MLMNKINRWYRGRALALVLALLCLLGPASLRPGVASAELSWCWDDPIVSINGKVVNIDIGVRGEPEEVAAAVKSTTTTIYLPRNVSARKLGSTNTYFREKVRFVTTDARWSGGPIPVSVVTEFTSSGRFDAQQRVSHDGRVLSTVKGSTAGALSQSFSLR
jgi:hypothetical protein